MPTSYRCAHGSRRPREEAASHSRRASGAPLAERLRLDSINPPEEIEGAHETLADRLDEVADILDEAADEAEDGDFFAAMAVLERAPDFLDADVRDAIRDIRTAGFYIGDESDWG